MLRTVKQMLEGSGIREKQIEDVYQLIKGSGRYPARMPSHNLATAIRMVHQDLEVRNRVPSVYVQDSWLATRWLRLNAGQGISTKLRNAAVDQLPPIDHCLMIAVSPMHTISWAWLCGVRVNWSTLPRLTR